MPEAENNIAKMNFFSFKSVPSAMNTLLPFSDATGLEEGWQLLLKIKMILRKCLRNYQQEMKVQTYLIL